MRELAKRSAKAIAPRAKLHTILFLALRIAVVTAAIHTLVGAWWIWSAPPSQSMLLTLGRVPAQAALLAYRLSMLSEVVVVNFLSWFVVALTVVFITREFRWA